MKASITQAEWADALVYAWQRHMKLGGLLCHAFEVEGQILTSADWDTMIERTKSVKPSIPQFTRMGNEVSSWIAGTATFANDALWAGKIDMAKKYFILGGRRNNSRARIRNEAKSAMPTPKNEVTIKARSLDKRSDWGTVK